ncbi:hypothetical protein F5X96DRAFT_668892 [Biscogniauxia mediterranea]|nr:hypothetical protein F5X96DRAFT_668892 [Biscogniauxia mediterranea]
MLFSQVIGGAAIALFTYGISAKAVVKKRQDEPPEVCTGNLLVDDFSSWADGVNSLNGATSDDGTMNATNTDGGVLTFTPNNINVSYIYEQFECLDTAAQGYSSLSFSIKAPEAASVSLELQTKKDCADEEYQSFYYTLNGLSSSLETLPVPLVYWVDANLDAVVGVVWYGFSAGLRETDHEWQLDNVQFICTGAVPPEDPPEPTAPEPTSPEPTDPEPTEAEPTEPAPTEPTPPPEPTTVDVTTTVITIPGGITTPPVITATTLDPFLPPITWPDWGDDDDGDDPWWGGWPTKRDMNDGQAATTISAEQDPAPTPEAGEECDPILIDDWASQSRLTFLYYNALLGSASDDGTMKSIVVKNNRVTFTPQDTDSYFYSQVGCINAEAYGGIALRIAAPKGSQFDVQLSSTKGECGGEQTTDAVLSTKELGWTFDGSEKLYSIPFSKFPGLDWTQFNMVFFTNLKKAVTLGPMGMYCGNTVAEYVVPAPVEPVEPSATVAAPPSKATNLVIDRFGNDETNELGEWHGADEGMTLTFRRNTMTLQTNDSDLMWVTQVAETCRDMTEFDGSYLHVAYSGSNKFTISLQQHNEECNNDIMPYPETWDSLEAARYSTESDIYIPMSHFNVDRTRVIGFAFKGFYTTEATVFSRVEIVSAVPAGVAVPEKLPSGTFVFACKRPNSFAFAIDDGDPRLAPEVVRTIEAANVTVTFFTVGAPLRDPATNLSAVYADMARRGHQIALHSYTHPALEGLPDEAAIDWEYRNDFRAVAETFGGMQSRYFRPPFGTEGARMRQRLAALVDDPYIVQWSVDVEDWLWAESDTPEKQLEAFKRDVAAGGNIVVMHYLYDSTVSYLQEFIDIAKATGKQLMRVDQCMMDPNAPPLPGE